jgi:hypothetical protein
MEHGWRQVLANPIAVVGCLAENYLVKCWESEATAGSRYVAAPDHPQHLFVGPNIAQIGTAAVALEVGADRVVTEEVVVGSGLG